MKRLLAPLASILLGLIFLLLHPQKEVKKPSRKSNEEEALGI